MRIITIIFLTLLTIAQAFGQTDKYGNPVFNSISIKENIIEDFLLITNYYTLRNNIENSHSSVFISEKPTLDQIEKAAINLPSNFYILTKESRVLVIVMLQNDPNKTFEVIVMKTNQQLSFSSDFKGDITESRANELITEKYDSKAFIKNDILSFNGKEFKIISNQDIEDAVWVLIQKEKLDHKEPSDIMIPSQDEIKNYIISETREGGELDFFTEIKREEYDGVQIKPGVFTTKQSIAFYKWGRACFEIGVNTIEDAYDIYSEFAESTVNERDKQYIKDGFNKELEK